MFRRATSAIAACAVVLTGLTFGAAPAGAIETITTTPPTYDPAQTVTIRINGFPNMVAGNGYIYWLDFSNMTGAAGNTGASSGALPQTNCSAGTGVTFTKFAGAGTADPNGQSIVGSTNACQWVSTTSFRFSYTGTAGLNSTSVVDVTFPAGAFSLPASGEYGVNFTAGASKQFRLSSVCWGNCPENSTGLTPPTVTLDFDGNGGTCTPGSVTGDQGTWGTALTADQCANGSKRLAFFSTSPTAAAGATNVRPGGPIYFLEPNRLYAIWAAEKPSPVTDVVTTPGLNSVKVTWKAPVSDGGDPINSYCVALRTEQSPNPFPRCSSPAQPLEFTFSRPATNTKYTPTVFARNSAGSSEPVAGAPASPYDIKDVTASRKNVLLGLGGSRFEAAGSAPGLAGQSLNVQFKVGSAQQWTTLANAAKVNAQSNFSWSRTFPASANRQTVAVRFTYGTDAVSGTYVLSRGGGAGDLSAPRNVKADGELNKVTLTWDPPKFDGGAKITGYTICAENIGTLCRDVGPSGQGDFRNLLPGASYSFTVAARTAAKTGPKEKANRKVRFTEASVRITAREPGSIIILAEGRGFPDANRLRLEVAPVPSTNQPRDRWRWAEIRTLTGGSRFSKTVEAELGSSYDDQTIAVRLVTPLGSVYSKPSRPPR